MKSLLLIAAFAVAASAQIPYFNCIDASGTPHAEDSLVYKVYPGNYQWLPLAMPVAGKCRIAFESYDDREDVNAAVTTAIGERVGMPIKPKGDIEILIVDEFGWQNYLAGRQYYAIWNSQRRFAMDAEVPLAAGSYRLIINNRYGSFASKSVTLTLGRGEVARQPIDYYPAPEYRAPASAPLATDITPNPTDQNQDTDRPKLTKRKKTRP